MKLGQMASYIDDGLPEPVRLALAELQSNAPPMSADAGGRRGGARARRAARAAVRRVGSRADRRGVDRPGPPRRVATRTTAANAPSRSRCSTPASARRSKPTCATPTCSARCCAMASTASTRPRWWPRSRSASPRSSTTSASAPTSSASSTSTATIRSSPSPTVRPTLCTSKVLTSELATGDTWATALTWDQHQRDLNGECLYRFVFRSLYRMRAFNGDPHPGNYLFHGDGRITFLDFGLVRYFTEDEIDLVRRHGQGLRRRPRRRRVPTPRRARRPAASGRAGVDRRRRPLLQRFLRPGCRGPHDDVDEGIRQRDRAAHVRPHQPDRAYATVPRSFVFIQRINLGLYALLGDLHATGNFRRMAEELWPPSTIARRTSGVFVNWMSPSTKLDQVAGSGSRGHGWGRCRRPPLRAPPGRPACRRPPARSAGRDPGPGREKPDRAISRG